MTYAEQLMKELYVDGWLFSVGYTDDQWRRFVQYFWILMAERYAKTRPA